MALLVQLTASLVLTGRAVQAADPGARFVHVATVASISSYQTILHHPATDYAPGAVVLVTQNFNPGGGAGVYNDHEIGVWYTGATWAIFNRDLADMPVGAAFNVTVLDPPFFSDGFETGNTSRWSATVP